MFSDFEDLLHHVVKDRLKGGISGFARRLGVGAKVMGNKVSANDGTHFLSPEQLLAAMREDKDNLLIDFFCHELGASSCPAPSSGSKISWTLL